MTGKISFGIRTAPDNPDPEESMNRARDRLFRLVEKIPVIDSHEHLGPESGRVGAAADFFTLFSHWPYIGRDLQLSGMTRPAFDGLQDRRIPLAERWKIFEPFWRRIRHTSYSRAVLIAVRKFYSADDITEKTFARISEAVAAFNRPGLYDAVLRDACGIRACLNDTGTTDMRKDLFVPVFGLLRCDMESREGLLRPYFAPDAKIASLDDYLDAARSAVLRVKSEGAKGLKMAGLNYAGPDRKAAEKLWNSMMSASPERISAPNEYPGFMPSNPLRDLITHETVRFGAEQGLVMAVHTGYWGDFRNVSPANIIPLLQRFPEAKFDIFHLGYPYVREALMLGKGFPNVWLNFCWLHAVSQETGRRCLDEALDLIPVNKIIGFGGDYGSEAVEMVYGHLTLARENIAAILADRISRKRMTEKQALDTAEMWLYRNAKELYGLEA